MQNTGKRKGMILKVVFKKAKVIYFFFALMTLENHENHVSVLKRSLRV